MRVGGIFLQGVAVGAVGWGAEEPGTRHHLWTGSTLGSQPRRLLGGCRRTCFAGRHIWMPEWL